MATTLQLFFAILVFIPLMHCIATRCFDKILYVSMHYGALSSNSQLTDSGLFFVATKGKMYLNRKNQTGFFTFCFIHYSLQYRYHHIMTSFYPFNHDTKRRTQNDLFCIGNIIAARECYSGCTITH